MEDKERGRGEDREHERGGGAAELFLLVSPSPRLSLFRHGTESGGKPTRGHKRSSGHSIQRGRRAMQILRP